jgi:hypothetical protein
VSVLDSWINGVTPTPIPARLRLVRRAPEVDEEADKIGLTADVVRRLAEEHDERRDDTPPVELPTRHSGPGLAASA